VEDSSVIQQHIQATKVGDGFADDPVDIRLPGDVGVEHEGRRPGVVSSLFQSSAAAADESHVRTGAGESDGASASDTCAGAGDDSGFIDKASHGVESILRWEAPLCP
jgi:hypothetical protein